MGRHGGTDRVTRFPPPQLMCRRYHNGLLLSLHSHVTHPQASMTRTHVLLAMAMVLLSASVSAAANDDPIQQAIDRGVAHLKTLQQDDGTWPHHQIGATALAAL